MLRELNVVEQRYRAVLEVLSGIPVIEVAERYGVARQTVHRWMARYRTDGIAGLADRSMRRTASVAGQRRDRGSGLRAAAGAPPVGTSPSGVRAGPPRLSGCVPVHGLPGPGPPSADRAGVAPQAA